jgi:delta 1-pyrroline-5-carboxylate dehydrogenase
MVRPLATGSRDTAAHLISYHRWVFRRTSPPICVEPWNFPYYQLARVAGAQLMAGNVLVVKHAGCVPQCAIAFEKLLLDAGAPVGAKRPDPRQAQCTELEPCYPLQA